MKQTILFDFDNTLFDNKKFRRLIGEKLPDLGLSDDLFDEIYREYAAQLEKNTDFDPATFIKLLSDKTQIDLHQIRDQFYDEALYKSCIYEDAIGVLESLKNKYKLGIFSEGVISWQKLKLEKTGLIKYFDQDLLFISRRKTADNFLQTIPEEIIIIDDNYGVIEDLQAFGKFQIFWLDRHKENFEGVPRVGVKQDPAVAVIASLTDFARVLEIN